MYLKEQSTYRYHRTGVSQPTCGWKLSYRFLQYKESRISYKQTWLRELNACNYNTQITKVQDLCDNYVTLKIYNDDMQFKLHVKQRDNDYDDGDDDDADEVDGDKKLFNKLICARILMDYY